MLRSSQQMAHMQQQNDQIRDKGNAQRNTKHCPVDPVMALILEMDSNSHVDGCEQKANGQKRENRRAVQVFPIQILNLFEHHGDDSCKYGAEKETKGNNLDHEGIGL